MHTCKLVLTVMAAAWATSAVSHAAVTAVNLDMSSVNESHFYSQAFYNGNGMSGDAVDVYFDTLLEHSASGGNAGARLIMTNTMTPMSVDDPEGTYADPTGKTLNMYVLTRYSNASYNPSIQGAIGSISYSIDVMVDTPATIYFELSDPINGFPRPAANIGAGQLGQWVTVTGTFAPDEFTGVTTTGNTTLRFGFDIETSIVSNGQVQTVNASFDNFIVTVEPVPEVGSLAMLAAGGMALIRRRR